MSRNKNSADIEEMLGLNVRPGRIVFETVDDKDLHRFATVKEVDWSKYSVYVDFPILFYV